MDYSKTSFPIQKLPLSKKTQEWKEQCVDTLIAREDLQYGNNPRKKDMQIAYDLYNSVFDEKDLMYVTDPFKVSEGFPASIQNINVIRPKIDLLLGEETKRPFNYQVIRTNDEAVTQMKEHTKKLLAQYVQQMIQSGIPPEEVSEDKRPPGSMTLAQIKEYMSTKYSTPEETLAKNTLNYLHEKLNLQNEYLKGFKDLLIAGTDPYFVGADNGDPVARRVNPKYLTWDYSMDSDFIDESDWQVYHMQMSPAEIYDRFYDFIEESDLDKILEYVGGTPMSGNKLGEVNTIINRTYLTSDITSSEFTDDTLDVWHVAWKSYKKVGFLSYTDESGEEQVDMVDETYKADEEEDIEWDWVIEVWEGYRVGKDIYLGIQPLEYQHMSIDNPNSQRMPYTGVVINDTNTESKSLVDIMKPLQYMYIVLWYRLELALARDKGKVVVMDPTQIPKSMGVDVNKWLHYLSAAGVMFVNPTETGFDVPGREGGKPAQFNQFGAHDLSMSKVISEYIQIMGKIEQMLGEMSGVSRQRQGAVSSTELVGNVERAVIQSSHITEPVFWAHNQAKKRVMTNLLNVAKHVWSGSNKKKLHYILSDSSRVFMDITEDFLYSDFDIFVTDSTKENQNLETLRTLLQPAMQNGATLSEVTKILTSNNINEIKSNLEIIEKRRQEQEQKAQEQQSMLQQQQIEAQQQQVAEENRIKEEDSIRKSETQIQVALINSESKIEGEYIKRMREENEDDYRKYEIDLMKIQAQEEAKQMENRIKERQLELQRNKNQTDASLKREELSIKRKQTNK